MPYPSCGSGLVAVSTKEECESSGVSLGLTNFIEGTWDIIPPNTCWINEEREEANWNAFSTYSDWNFVCGDSGGYNLENSECTGGDWVKSESDCRAAAAALGASFGNIASWNNLPPEVCWGDSNTIHWNEGLGYSAQIICKPSLGILFFQITLHFE